MENNPSINLAMTFKTATAYNYAMRMFVKEYANRKRKALGPAGRLRGCEGVRLLVVLVGLA
jgi:hypothetical protein